MKKKWLNFIFALALMLTGVSSFVLPTEESKYEKETQSVVSTYEEQNIEPEIAPIDPVDPPAVDPIDLPTIDPVDPVDPQEPSEDPVDPVDPETETDEITSYTKKTLDDYFTDFNIPTTIAETTITGSGVQSDPYIINSTDDFYFLKRTSHNNQYIELNCDVILNDEVFDADGNPSGGDGTYYNWSSIYASNLNFDGKGHTISGLFFEYIDSISSNSLFAGNYMTIRNVNFKNVYINGTWASVIGGQYSSVYNCVVYSGTIKGTDRVGMIGQRAINIQNCINYADVYASSLSVGGICALLSDTLASTVINCKNYGNVYGGERNANIGGIVGYAYKDNQIVNCQNYGDIDGNNVDIAGGICGSLTKVKVIQCTNYGDLSNCSGGGIDGNALSATINNCKNYGYIAIGGVYRGSIIGTCSGAITILNFQNGTQKSDGLSLIGVINAKTQNANIIITNCKFNISGSTADVIHSSLLKSAPYTINLSISSCRFNVAVEENQSYFIENTYGYIDKIDINNVEMNVVAKAKFLLFLYTGGEFNLNNIIININPSSSSKYNCLFRDNSNLDLVSVNGVIINSSNTDVVSKVYYGTNFNGYYIPWKTSKIGLTALDSLGSFYGSVTPSVLEYYGYEPATI